MRSLGLRNSQLISLVKNIQLIIFFETKRAKNIYRRKNPGKNYTIIRNVTLSIGRKKIYVMINNIIRQESLKYGTHTKGKNESKRLK